MIWLLMPSPLPVSRVLRNHNSAVRWQTAGRPHTGPLEGRQTWAGLGVTAVCTVADSYVAATAREAGAAAERAAELKISKYSGLEDKCVFQPIPMESLGPLNETACQFLKDLGRRISA